MLQLNKVETIVNFDNCHYITDTIFTYKKLLSVMYRLMEAKSIKIGIQFVRAGFKKTNISQQLNINRMTE